MSKKTVVILLAVAIVAASVFAFADTVKVQALPSPESLCGEPVRLQVRLYLDTQAYADSALTQPVVLLRATEPGKSRAKWLVCEKTLSGKSWQIYFVGRLLWIPAGSGEVVPRQFRDNQP